MTETAKDAWRKKKKNRMERLKSGNEMKKHWTKASRTGKRAMFTEAEA